MRKKTAGGDWDVYLTKKGDFHSSAMLNLVMDSTPQKQ